MKKGFVSVYKVILVIILCGFVFLAYGCASYYERPGETAAEGHRRHIRNLRINQQELMQDIDAALLTDEPSELSELRIP